MTLPGDPFEAKSNSDRPRRIQHGEVIPFNAFSGFFVPDSQEPAPYLDQTGLRAHQMGVNQRLRLEVLHLESSELPYRIGPGAEGQ